MKNNETRGSVALNIILIVVLCLIAIAIYKLSTVSRADISDNSPHGIESVSRPNTNDGKQRNVATPFRDGLTGAASSTNFAPDEIGAGITNITVFERDLDNDGRSDRITRTHVETGTAHSYDEYKIELNRGNGQYVDVTPENFRTIDGADCALAKLQFDFAPNFRVTKIERPWRDTWTTPTPAVRTVYALINGEMVTTGVYDAGAVCDVSQLF